GSSSSLLALVQEGRAIFPLRFRFRPPGSHTEAYREGITCAVECPVLGDCRAQFERPPLAADSTGQRNSFMKSLCGRFVLQRLPWSFVEAPSDGVELGL